MALRIGTATLGFLASIGCGPTLSTVAGAEGTGGEQAETDAGSTGSTSVDAASADVGSSTGTLPPWMWSDGCVEGLDGPPVDEMQASDILFRVLDEGRHHAERVQLYAAMLDGTGSESLSYEEADGDGVLTVDGSVSVEPFGSLSSEHVAEFVCYTGGHGGFGPVALDGRVDISVGGVTNTMDDYNLAISGTVRLGGGDAFSPTPPAELMLELSVTSGSEAVTGSVGGHDASTL